ncbi:MAG: TrkH family potassium uptake protein [Dehalococcoidia bacterium]|nr:TrkH family potassium uptake protein [Dehalococcoidia bacterium]
MPIFDLEERKYRREQSVSILRIPRSNPWRVPLTLIPQPKEDGISPMSLIYGFAAIIAVGTILLCLPISSRSGHFTSLLDALFTSTSATCVTGLVVVDTGTHWNSFGQGVILALIQIGGLGFMTSATLFLIALGRRIGLQERLLIAESMGLERLGGLVGLVKRIAIFVAVTEIIGAALFYIHFSTESSTGTALWRSVFLSVSAFNNAGFDIFGNFRSLMDYQTDTLVILVTATLVFLGGISFIVLANVFTARRLNRFSLDTKIVLSTTGVLLGLGTIIILLTEYSNAATLGPLAFPQKILVAFFQSVSPRTAGFTTFDVGGLKEVTLFVTILLMFIGGAAGSTAGGIKVNTFGMLATTIWSSLRGRENAGVFGREFAVQQVYRAMAVVALSLGLVSIVVLVLTMTEDVRFLYLFFETVSAFGTVGLSTGITPDLTTAGHLIIILTMFVGRFGPLTLALMLVQRQKPTKYQYPREAVRIG